MGSVVANYNNNKQNSIQKMDTNQPIVIDNGSGIIKAGFAGADKPRSCLYEYMIACVVYSG